MSPKHIILTSVLALRTHVARSLLTILGIVIGVAAIIIVMAIGQGAKNLILDQVSGLGPETVVLRPGRDTTELTSVLFSETLTQNDLDALERKQNVPNLVEYAPYVIVSEVVEYRGETYRPTLMGGPAEFMADLLDFGVADGEFYTDADAEQRARVVVIGEDVRADIFGNNRGVGEQILIGDRKFKVIGVLEEAGRAGPFDVDELIMVPHTSAQTYITGDNFFNEVFLVADDAAHAEKMAYDIRRTLREEHDIGFDEDDDFHVQTYDDVIGQIKTIVNVFTSFLISVVAISLVVGGIGIMNIMLVSVSERTKEIGLRKALGARDRDILRQFLAEAVILTSIGGLIGIIAGSVIAFGIAVVLAQTVAENWAFAFPFLGALLGVGMSAAVGLIFGIYPAKKAAEKSPIEALRYE